MPLQQMPSVENINSRRPAHRQDETSEVEERRRYQTQAIVPRREEQQVEENHIGKDGGKMTPRTLGIYCPLALLFTAATAYLTYRMGMTWLAVINAVLAGINAYSTLIAWTVLK
jgi:hypothetical protein